MKGNRKTKHDDVSEKDQLQGLLEGYVAAAEGGWNTARALVVPHYNNANESLTGEWITTAIVNHSGYALESGAVTRLPIYQSRQEVIDDLQAYLTRQGCGKPEVHFVHLDDAIWQKVERLKNHPAGEDLLWEIFKRSRSPEDIAQGLANCEKSLGIDLGRPPSQ